MRRRLACPDPPALSPLIDLAALGSALASRGVELRSGAPADAGDVALVAEVPRPVGVPTIVLAPGEVPGRLRLSEYVPAPSEPFDQRPDRLADRYAAALAPDLIGSAAAALPAIPPKPDETRERWRRRRAVEAIWNDLPPAPGPVADALAEAVGALAPRPRPTVSIVISAYNYARYVDAAIASALTQTDPADEVIVVDDGSTDGTAERVAATPGIVAIQKPNGGQASAMNAGYARARGDVVLFLDADDLLYSGAVAMLRQASFDRVARQSFALETVDAEGAPLGLYPTSRTAVEGHLAGPLGAWGIFPFMPTSGNAFPRWALDRIFPLVEADWRLCADLYLVMAASTLGPARHSTAVLGAYRIHGANGYFKARGDAPVWNAARLDQRRRAWRDLARRLAPDRGRYPGLAGALRRLERAVGEPLHRGAGALAWLRTGVAPTARRAIRDTPFGAEGRRAAPNRAARAILGCRDRMAFGGPSAWPVVETGQRILADPRTVGPLGHGWRVIEGSAALDGPAPTLCFTVIGPPTDWTVEVDYALGHGLAAATLDIWCNGTRIERLTLAAAGLAPIHIPADLLRFDPALGAYAVGLAFTGADAQGGRVRVAALTLHRAVGPGRPAPLLSPGPPSEVGDKAAARALGEGWHWLTGAGVRMSEAAATVSISLAARGAHALTLFGSGPAPNLTLNGRLAAARPGPDGRTISAEVPAEAVGRNGRLDIGVLAAPGGGEPFRLDALSAVPAEGATPLGQPLDPADLMPDRTDGADLSLRLNPPSAAGPLRLWLDLEVAAGAPLGVRLNGRRIDVHAQGRCWVPLNLPPGAEGATLALTGDGAQLHGALYLPRRVRRADPDTGPLGPETLLAAATDPGDWHPALDEALWLAAPTADLTLPAQPPGGKALEIMALTLSAFDQTLTLTLGDTKATLRGDGPQTAALPLDDDARVLRLSTDRLVAPDLLGVEGPGLLGGALLGVRYIGAVAKAAE